MIGYLDDSKEVTVVGAGIAGLLSSYYLDRAGYTVTLLEASERAGGLLSTHQSENGMVESAAHSFPTTPTIEALCRDLGVELETVPPESRARYIYRKRRLRRFPLTILETIRAFFRAYLILAPKRDPEILNLEQWTRRFLGKPALRYLIAPFVRGIYGTQPSELNVSAAFPYLCVPRGHSLLSYLLARKWRKVPPKAFKRDVPRIPRGEIVAPKNGMQSLVDALDRHLSNKLGDRYRKGKTVESLKDLGHANVILCVPAKEAAALLEMDAPELSTRLKEVRYSPLTTVTAFVAKKSLGKIPEGIGVLMPEGEGRKSLGILFNSSAFAGRTRREGLVSLTLMFEKIPAEGLEKAIATELGDLFGLNGPVREIITKSWGRAVPKYDDHLLHTWEVARESWCAKPGRILFGNYTGQVSIRGMAELASRIDSKQ